MHKLKMQWHAFRAQPALYQVRCGFERALEVVAIIWTITNFSFQPVIPVYQWY